jgi:SAM-dependent methyltransferase
MPMEHVCPLLAKPRVAKQGYYDAEYFTRWSPQYSLGRRNETTRLPASGEVVACGLPVAKTGRRGYFARTEDKILRRAEGMSKYFHHRSTCRLCHSADVELAVPLAPMPAATLNVDLAAGSEDFKGLDRIEVPLDLYLCRACGHLQLLDVIEPEVLYRNFLWTTSVSPGLPEHFEQFAGEMLAHGQVPGGGLVLEIGSNDGTLLQAFKRRGMRVLGIDPALKIAERATEQGIVTLPLFFNRATAQEIRAEYGPAALVICNYTFANLDDLDDIVEGIQDILAPNGIFVFETSYGADVVTKALIDTVYHEHLSYFMVGPLERFFAAHGLELFDAQRIWTKGGSLRGFVQRAGDSRAKSPAVGELVAEEVGQQLNQPAPYRRFTAKLRGMQDEISRHVESAERTGRLLVGYGASIGSVTLIQLFHLTQSLSFLVDDKPRGTVMQMPERSFKIELPSILYEQGPTDVVILAWRYAQPIMSKHQSLRDHGTRFIVPLPDVVIH